MQRFVPCQAGYGAKNGLPFKVSTDPLFTDPLFVDRVRDVVDLHLNPPDQALVPSVDAKSLTQALDRTQPLPPM